MEQVSSWEASTSSDSKESIRILRNLKIHYSVHNSPPLIPVLSKINPIHSTPHPLTTYFLFELLSASLNSQQ